MIAFISGHIDLTPQEFEQHYVPRIDKALALGHRFVVGDANGADAMAQKYIASKTNGAFLDIYHMFVAPRNRVDGAGLKGGFFDDASRDAAMTEQSFYDIAWVRPGREKSGTQKNINRRNKHNV